MDFSSFLLIGLATLVAAASVGGLDARERRGATIAFGAHVVSSFGNFAIVQYFYEGGDIYQYQEYGKHLARLLDLDFIRFAPEVVALAFHQEANLPIDVPGAGSSTGTMSALAAFVIFAVGSSLLSMCVAVTLGSWFGQLCLYRIAREELDEADRPAALVGLLFVPSVVYWGGGFTKEAIVIAFLGPMALSTYRVFRRRSVPHLVGGLVAAGGVGLLKSYTLFAYVVAVAAGFYADRAWRLGAPVRLRPAYLVLAVALGVGGIVGMGRLFPEYEATQVAETVAMQQQAWESTQGGSNIEEVGSGEARSIPEQVVFVPIAFANALLRPAVFDVRNGPTFVAAVENTLILLGLLMVFRSPGRGMALEKLLRTPWMVYSVVFVLIFGVGVGLTTSNLGSLSRYRAPMMPFYVTTLLIVRERLRRAAPGLARVRAYVVPRRSRAA